MSPYKIKKCSGKSEEFNKSKLSYSLVYAGATKEQAQNITNRVYSSCCEGESTRRIYKKAYNLLKKQSKILATQYSLTRSIQELGPDGYHFEKFISAIFKAQGYNSSTNKILQGRCISHEVDVVAKKGKEIIYCECKFHNKPGIKDDLKTALYVQARALDLKEAADSVMTNFWLISNTKFSTDAVSYANCAGLTLLSSNYPKKNSLADLAKKYHVYPITSLINLNKNQKSFLLAKGMTLIDDINFDDPSFKSLSLDEDKIKKISKEIATLKRSFRGN